MEPFTVSLLGSAAFWAVKRWRETKAKRGLPDPPLFSPEQIWGFTHLTAGARQFDADFSAALRKALEYRSARLLDPKDLGLPPDYGAQIFRLEPIGAPPTLPRGSKVVEDAQAAGLTVLGSLSLRMLTAGTPDAMLIVVGPGAVRDMAAPSVRAPDGVVHQGWFAIFPPPPTVEPAKDAVVKATEPTKDDVVAATEPTKDDVAAAAEPHPPNGAAAPVDMSGWDRVAAAEAER